ncbi:hypothetical protein [Pseudooceanicola sp. MF1-13]|uniref:hypothetical protein n=1 Tax=Pseudooceanicola sp. MF1-13 TaxID=3379095 RepID=UPI003891D25A
MTDPRLPLAWCCAIGLALMGPLLPLLTMPPADGDLVLVLSPPWADAMSIIDQAGGRPVGPETSWIGAFAQVDQMTQVAGFADRLKQAGAWAAFDGTAIAALCGWESS